MKQFKVEVDGKNYDVGVEEIETGKFSIELNKKKYTVNTEEIFNEEESTVKKQSSGGGSATINAKIPGTVGKINIKEGKSVKEGDILLTLIAMKMENEIKSTMSGKIKKIHVKEGQNVDVGDLLVELG